MATVSTAGDLMKVALQEAREKSLPIVPNDDRKRLKESPRFIRQHIDASAARDAKDDERITFIRHLHSAEALLKDVNSACANCQHCQIKGEVERDAYTFRDIETFKLTCTLGNGRPGTICPDEIQEEYMKKSEIARMELEASMKAHAEWEQEQAEIAEILTISDESFGTW